VRRLIVAMLAGVLFTSATARAEDDARAAPPDALPRTALHVLASGGASYRRLYAMPFATGVATVGVGSDSEHLGLWAHGDYEGGRLDHGLGLRIIRVGGGADWIVGRLRLGGGVDLSSVSVRRATNGTTIDQFGPGVFAGSSVDLVAFRDHALVLGARGDFDVLAHTLGASGSLGLRF
jgi:hypothetical protein